MEKTELKYEEAWEAISQPFSSQEIKIHLETNNGKKQE